MTRNLVLAFYLMLSGCIAASSQQTVRDTNFMPPHFSVAAGYNLIRANAPPGSCQCFSMNGGFVSGDLNLSPWLGVTGQFTYNRSKQISSLGQDLSLTTYKAGPKIFWAHFRFTPFVEYLLGGAHGGNSYFPSSTSDSTSANSFTYSPGAGLDIRLTSHLSVRAIEAEYVHTGFPNGGNNAQNQLQIGAGAVASFGFLGHRLPRN